MKKNRCHNHMHGRGGEGRGGEGREGEGRGGEGEGRGAEGRGVMEICDIVLSIYIIYFYHTNYILIKDHPNIDLQLN